MILNKNFAKIENGGITYAPKTLVINNVRYYNPKPDRYIREGFFPVEDTPAPEGNESGYYVPDGWILSDGKIVQLWRFVGVESEVEK